MPVHFVGAGPGDPDLLTIRGRDLLRAADAVLYAGSLVPKALLAEAKKAREIIDSAPLSLETIIAHIDRLHQAGCEIIRLHSGDLSLYSAVAEQIRHLNRLHIPYDMTPGVPAYAAAASALGQELTLPGITQSVILTRTATRSSAMPPGETLNELASGGATMAIHLSAANLAKLVTALIPHYGARCPSAALYRLGWPDAQIIRAPLDQLRAKVKAARITRTALILVGPALAADHFSDSRLYDAEHHHLFRNATRNAIG